MSHNFHRHFVICLFAVPWQVGLQAQEDAAQVKPLRALLITGGCCHDYAKQIEIIKQGLSQRANIEWEVFHGTTPREREIPIYQSDDWARGFDVVVHNECYGSVTNVEYVERIVKSHVKHQVPAVVIHCSMHSYRNAKTDEWRKLLGVTSRRHEPGGPPLQVVGRHPQHPILKGFATQWQTPKGELYVIEKTWPNMVTLATAFGRQTQQDQPVIWINEYQGVRLFGTTLGHHNETMLTQEWLEVVTRGLLWTCGKLADDGSPRPGFGGTGIRPILLPGEAPPERTGEPTLAKRANNLTPPASFGTPFAGQAHLIPGLVEAEHYDEGNAGQAYYDTDTDNQGVTYRKNTQVDIEKRPDASNGHGVGWTRNGEWLNYSVDVARTGFYDLEIPVASNKRGGTFHLEFNGKDVTGPIHVPDTGSWQTLQMVYATGVHLEAGKQTMKLVMDSEGPSGSIGDIDYIHFVNSNVTDNTLSALEHKAGWRLLFNGIDHSGWKCNSGKPIATPVEDGALVPYKSGGYLILHEDRYGDFILKCDVKWEAERCNSGIFFRVADPNNPVHTGFEVQVMSGTGIGKHDLGAIYDLVAPSRNVGKPAGQWNTVEIKCQGPNIAVRVNGQWTTEMSCDDFDQPGKAADGEAHKFRLNGQPRAVKDFARNGFLGFQDHGQKVWYKNVKLLPL